MLKNVIAVLAFGIVSVMAMPGDAQTPPRTKITGISVSLGFYGAPIMVAEKMGYFRDENIDFDLLFVKSGGAAMSALMSGAGQFYIAPFASTIQAIDKGANVKIFAPIMNQYASNVLVSKEVKDRFSLNENTPVAKRIEALKGLRIAAHMPGTSPDLLVRYIAKQQGWNPERDLTIMPITTEAMIPALQNKRVDSFVISPPTADMGIMQAKAFMLLNVVAGEYPPLDGFMSNGLIANTEWLAKDEEKAVRILKATWRAIKFIEENPEEAKERVKGYFPELDPKVLDAGFQDQRKAIPSVLRMTDLDIQRNIDFLAATRGEEIKVNVPSVYTNRIVELAEQSMK